MGQGVKPQLLFRSNINVSNSLAPCTENCHKLESSIVWLIVNLYITASFQWSTFPTIPCPELHIYLKNKYAINFFIIVCHVLKLSALLCFISCCCNGQVSLWRMRASFVLIFHSHVFTHRQYKVTWCECFSLSANWVSFDGWKHSTVIQIQLRWCAFVALACGCDKCQQVKWPVVKLPCLHPYSYRNLTNTSVQWAPPSS